MSKRKVNIGLTTSEWFIYATMMFSNVVKNMSITQHAICILRTVDKGWERKDGGNKKHKDICHEFSIN